MKNNYLHTVFAITLTLIVLFPFTIQALHAINKHEHQICTAKDVKHIHQQDLDCSIFHQQIDNNSFDLSTDINIHDPIVLSSKFYTYKQPNCKENLSSKSSRAPPYFII